MVSFDFNAFKKMGEDLFSNASAKITTRLELVNNTKTDIINATMSSMDNFDWGGLQPLFKNDFIPSKTSKERIAILTENANHCPFEMKLIFADGTIDTFRMHQKYPFDKCRGFQHFTGPHKITPRSVDGNKVVIDIEDK